MRLKLSLDLNDEIAARFSALDNEVELIEVRKDVCLLLSGLGEVISLDVQEEEFSSDEKVVDCTDDEWEQLNTGQRLACEGLLDWFQTKRSQTARLLGGGGVGKTFTISFLVKKLVEEGIYPVFITPTHEARRVLKSSLLNQDCPGEVATIAQFLGRQPILTDEGKEKFSSSGKDRDLPTDLVIVDESSMVDDEDYRDILIRSDRVIFIGDQAQLPPVGQESSLVFSETENSFELIQIMRSKGYLSEQVKLSRDSSLTHKIFIPQSSQSDSIIRVRKRESLELAMMYFSQNEWAENPNYCRFLAFRNKIVTDTNNYFRKRLVGKDSMIFEGNLVKCLKPIYRVKFDPKEKKNSWVNYANTGDNLRIISSPASDSVDDLIAEAFHYSDCEEASLLFGNVLMFEVTNDEGFSFYGLVLDETAEKSRQSLIKRLQDKLPTLRDKKPAKKLLSWLFKLNDSLSDLYCSTVHKAQGSSIDNVFVVVDDLMKKPYKAKGDIRPKLLYTAFSRAKTKLYLVSDE